MAQLTQELEEMRMRMAQQASVCQVHFGCHMGCWDACGPGCSAQSCSHVSLAQPRRLPLLGCPRLVHGVCLSWSRSFRATLQRELLAAAALVLRRAC